MILKKMWGKNEIKVFGLTRIFVGTLEDSLDVIIRGHWGVVWI